MSEKTNTEEKEIHINKKVVSQSMEGLCEKIYREEEREVGLKELLCHMEAIFKKPMYPPRQKHWAPVLKQVQKRIAKRIERRKAKAEELANNLLGNDPRFKKSEDVREATARVVHRWITNGDIDLRSQKSIESLVRMFNEIRWVYNLKAEEIPLDNSKIPARLLV